MNPVKLLALVSLLFGSALAAQPDINVQYPVGTSVNSGQTVNFGDDPSGDAIMLTIRIENTGTTDLNLTQPVPPAQNRPVNCSGAKNLDWNLSQPATAVVTAGNFVDFALTLNPRGKGDWEVLMRVYSDDPDAEATYSVRFKGSAGEEEKDEDCSTSEGSGLGLMMLLGLVSLLAVGMRLRGARA